MTVSIKDRAEGGVEVQGERIGRKKAERWNCLGNYLNMQEKDWGWCDMQNTS